MANEIPQWNAPTPPVPLSSEEIREFQRMVHDSTGEWLDEETAARRASQLVYLVAALVGDFKSGGGSNVVQT